nr:MAG TPA: hypothetical protein [Caudoviricetes sp.]
MKKRLGNISNYINLNNSIPTLQGAKALSVSKIFIAWED